MHLYFTLLVKVVNKKTNYQFKTILNHFCSFLWFIILNLILNYKKWEKSVLPFFTFELKTIIYNNWFPNKIWFWNVHRLTLKSTMPWLWNAHLARAWTRRLDIFFPSALHFARQIHNSFSRLSTICLRCCIICNFIKYREYQ